MQTKMFKPYCTLSHIHTEYGPKFAQIKTRQSLTFLDQVNL